MTIIWSLTPTFGLSRSKFNSIANFDPLMANDGSLKLWD